MEQTAARDIDEAAMKRAIIEIKLAVNQSLYAKKAITEEMFQKAKEMILRGA
jgi:replicative DNA helicase